MCLSGDKRTVKKKKLNDNKKTTTFPICPLFVCRASVVFVSMCVSRETVDQTVVPARITDAVPAPDWSLVGSR